MKFKVKEIEQTCYGCPCTWVGTLENDTKFRIRYRFGILRLTIGEYQESVECGETFDGNIELDEVKELLDHILEF